MSDADRIDEAFDRVIGNNEAHRLGKTSGIEKPEECLELMALMDAMPDNREKLGVWYRFGRKEAAENMTSPTLDEVNARRGY